MTAPSRSQPIREEPPERISGPRYLITVLSNQFYWLDADRRPVSVMEAGPWNR